jgi:hypothetical protein
MNLMKNGLRFTIQNWNKIKTKIAWWEREIIVFGTKILIIVLRDSILKLMIIR